MNGFDQADIRRIRAQEARARGLALLEQLTNPKEEDENENLES